MRRCLCNAVCGFLRWLGKRRIESELKDGEIVRMTQIVRLKRWRGVESDQEFLPHPANGLFTWCHWLRPAPAEMALIPTGPIRPGSRLTRAPRFASTRRTGLGALSRCKIIYSFGLEGPNSFAVCEGLPLSSIPQHTATLQPMRRAMGLRQFNEWVSAYFAWS